MSLAARKGKGWMLIEVERRRNVPSMIAVYTTGLTRPLNSVLIFIFISLGQLLSCARWVFNFYFGSCSQFAHVHSGSPPSSDWRGGRWRARQRFLGTVPSSCHRATAPVEEERSRCVFSRGRPALPAPPEQRYTRREPPVIRLRTLNFNVELLHQPFKMEKLHSMMKT